MINGIVNIYKEAGFTSHDVVAKLRGITRQKKIGHTGTLDPDAVGVLPVCFGNATKLCDMMTDKSKEYEAVLYLGVKTDTQDMSGRVVSTADVNNINNINVEKIKEVIIGFVGGYEQLPPMYSALKVNGKKLYELAREGKEVERQPRHVDIPSIEIKDISLPRVSFSVECSKGTYIRTLCNDIGDRLGCGGAMESLRRTRVGRFKISDSITLSQFEEFVKSGELEKNMDKYVLSCDSVFMENKRARIKDNFLSTLLNGNKLYFNQLDFENNPSAPFGEGELIRVYDDKDAFRAVYTFIKGEKCFKPYKMFL
jgi:tRNA pseudouridine55 synthase